MRYSRQEILIGKSNQTKLNKATAAIIGLGATGSVTAQILARAGINLVLVDRDIVEFSNIQRQLYKESDVGLPKVNATEEKIKKINSQVKTLTLAIDLNPKNINQIKADIILDCTDNLQTRFLINDYSLKKNIPWIYCAGITFSATVMPFIPDKNRACFRCVFEKSISNETCDTSGVMAPATFIAASLQSNLAIDILLGKKPTDMLRFNLSNYELTKIKVKKKDCHACKGIYDYLEGDKFQYIKELCGKGTFQFYTNKKLSLLKKNLKKIGEVKSIKGFFQFRNISVFEDGRVLVVAKNKKQASSIFSKLIGN